jgi:hypothetical protein
MCYAAWTKGRTALLCAVLATADALGVWPQLERQWERNWPGFPEEATKRAQVVTAKAWRFAGEMGEIAATLERAGLPGGFHCAAGEVYQRMAHFKEASSLPSVHDVLKALQDADSDE